MGKKFSLYLRALIFFCLVSTSSFQFNWQNSKRKHGGGKIKEIGKIHVHHNFWRDPYCSQTVRQTTFVRGSPAQKTRTGTQLECSNTQGLQGWKRCQSSGTTDSNVVALWGPAWTGCSKWLRCTKATAAQGLHRLRSLALLQGQNLAAHTGIIPTIPHPYRHPCFHCRKTWKW